MTAPSTDLACSRDFYETVLGLELVDENPYAGVFSSGHGTLRVVPVEAHVPAGHTVVGWVVPDIEATLRALADSGVDDRVVWFTDPDGNVLSVTQLKSA